MRKKSIIFLSLIICISILCVSCKDQEKKNETSNEITSSTEITQNEEKSSTEPTSQTTTKPTINISEKDISIEYTIPEGYSLQKKECEQGEYITTLYYANNNLDTIEVSEENTYGFEEVINTESFTEIEEYTTKNGLKCNMYKDKDVDTYYFTFEKNKKKYDINGQNVDDVKTLLDSIK